VAAVALLGDGELDAVALGQANEWLGLAALADNEDVLETRGEGVASEILDVDDVEHARVTVTGRQDADAAPVTARVAVHLRADLELEEADRAHGLEVNLDCVEDLGVRVRVAHGLAVVGDNVWHAAGAEAGLDDLAELELGLFLGDGDRGVAALDVVQHAVVLVCGRDGDGVHEAGREGQVRAGTAVDLHEAVLEDHHGLLVRQRVLEALAEQDDQRQTVTQLVWAGGWTRRESAGQFVKHPMLGGIEPLKVLLRTASHDEGSRGEGKVSPRNVVGLSQHG